MIVKPPSPAAGFVRRHDGGWFDRVLPYLPGFLETQLGERNAYVARVADETGQAANTARRALGALAYLKEQGVDLEAMRARPAIMSIEAISRVERHNTGLAADLLRKLLAGEGTVATYRAEAERIMADIERARPLPRERLLLSDVVVANLPLRRDFLSIQWFDNRPLMPTIMVDLGVFRLVVFVVAAHSPVTKLANASLLIEGTVLRSLVSCSKTVVCSEIALDELSKTAKSMRPDLAAQLDIRLVSIANDLSTEGERALLRQRILDRPQDR
ncbi:hypothetical protein ACXIUS_04340 [Bosea thiooxidans]|jgi:hypothetical protein|uniref:Uncharacterized protein n=1 Tax=Bosea thiooxidans TaxID=53254 RepID=A0A0Q3I664_9HYPH|nr:hypothetical protein [Bosea thiooxidans]KQK30448.1 hypothetical protein ARD30_13565 [Bosea thiooxidans]